MRGTSSGRSHPRPCSGKKTWKRSQNNEQADNVNLIDVDSEQSDYVIIIDVPDSFPKKWRDSSQRTKDKKQSLRTVICIDDDESPVNRHSGMGAKKAAFAARGTTSRSFIHSTNEFEDVDVEELQFDQESVTPVRLSKCKRTYSGKASTGNNYGLSADSESDSSASDYPDCELMEDVSGKVQEQWEKAFSRRKKGIRNGQLGMGYQNDTSRVNIDNYHKTLRKGQDNQNKAFRSSTDKFSNDDAGPSPLSNSNHALSGRLDSGGELSPSIHAGHKGHRNFEPGCSSSHHRNRWNHPAPSNSSYHEQTTKEYMSSGDREEVEDDHRHTENGRTSNSVENCIINRREIIKETDEYKRAMEEEWATRQQALQIQAEEARRLRQLQKRKKAESIRLLDMERRQKERVEEIRSTQKKDEENMNLKEVVRTEVRKELQKLEVSCHDMAALLHSLGIHVNGWPNPLQQEVQSAYKRALLSFHPDRASRYDLRQQVEAEEKFKLVTLLKKKFG